MAKSIASSTRASSRTGANGDAQHFNRHVGERLRIRRMLLRISQEQLAAECGISPQQIHNYEAGRSRMSASRLVELASALDMPVAWFFDGIGSIGDGGHLPPPHQMTVESRELLDTYYRITCAKLRHKVIEVARVFADREHADPSHDSNSS